MEKPIEMDDLGVKPPIFGNILMVMGRSESSETPWHFLAGLDALVRGGFSDVF